MPKQRNNTAVPPVFWMVLQQHSLTDSGKIPDRQKIVGFLTVAFLTMENQLLISENASYVIKIALKD